MLNEEKYRSPHGRLHAFDLFCTSHHCFGCPANGGDFAIRQPSPECIVRWLCLDWSIEELQPCPYCGCECTDDYGPIECTNPMCRYSVGSVGMIPSELIALHNNMCKAVAKARSKR